MKTHDVLTTPHTFQMVSRGLLTWLPVRKERGVATGDLMILHWQRPEKVRKSIEILAVRVVHVTRDDEEGGWIVKPNFDLLSIDASKSSIALMP